MVEHRNQSQPNPGLPAHGTPCTEIRKGLSSTSQHVELFVVGHGQAVAGVAEHVAEEREGVGARHQRGPGVPRHGGQRDGAADRLGWETWE